MGEQNEVAIEGSRDFFFLSGMDSSQINRIPEEDEEEDEVDLDWMERNLGEGKSSVVVWCERLPLGSNSFMWKRTDRERVGAICTGE